MDEADAIRLYVGKKGYVGTPASHSPLGSPHLTSTRDPENYKKPTAVGFHLSEK